MDRIEQNNNLQDLHFVKQAIAFNMTFEHSVLLIFFLFIRQRNINMIINTHSTIL